MNNKIISILTKTALFTAADGITQYKSIKVFEFLGSAGIFFTSVHESIFNKK